MKSRSTTVRLPSGNSIEYGEYGDLAGRPLFYFHGWPSSQFQARSLQDGALKRGIRVISPNRPGIGRSTPEPGRTLSDWPPVLLELADVLGVSKCHVLGVSGGGPYALAVAAELPGLVAGVGVACGAVPLAEIPDRHEMLVLYRILLWCRKHIPWILPPIIHGGRLVSKCPPRWFPMSLILRFFEPCDREALRNPETFEEVMVTYRDAAASGTGAVLGDADVYLQDWDVDLSQIRCPLYFWHGEKDQNIPIRMAKYLASKFPRARCRWFPEEGHFSLGLQKTGIFLDALFGRSDASLQD